MGFFFVQLASHVTACAKSVRVGLLTLWRSRIQRVCVCVCVCVCVSVCETGTTTRTRCPRGPGCIDCTNLADTTTHPSHGLAFKSSTTHMFYYNFFSSVSQQSSLSTLCMLFSASLNMFTIRLQTHIIKDHPKQAHTHTHTLTKQHVSKGQAKYETFFGKQHQQQKSRKLQLQVGGGSPHNLSTQDAYLQMSQTPTHTHTYIYINHSNTRNKHNKLTHTQIRFKINTER